MEPDAENPPVIRVRTTGDAILLYIHHPLMWEKLQGAAPLPADSDLLPELIPYIALTPNDAWRLANIVANAAINAGAVAEEDEDETNE
jgi:hypothetical protein